MQVEWSLTAATYLDQLTGQERSRVVHAADQLRQHWKILEGVRLHRVGPGQDGLFSLSAGPELRILVQRRGDTVSVVDVVRNSQIVALRRAAERQEAAPA